MTKTNGGGLQNFAATAVAKMNTALANNGLDAHFRFRLVGTTELPVSASDVHTALYAVDDDDPGWAAVKTKRDEVGADIVTVLIDTGTAYGTTGVSWSLERAEIASFADDLAGDDDIAGRRNDFYGFHDGHADAAAGMTGIALLHARRIRPDAGGSAVV